MYVVSVHLVFNARVGLTIAMWCVYSNVQGFRCYSLSVMHQ